MKTYSIREVISNISEMSNSWFYLPDTPWALDTKGAFSLDSRDFPTDSKDYLPPQVLSQDWKEVLEAPTIEYITLNINEQLLQPSIENHLDAFKFYH